jgi:hypothetical protein
MTREELAHAFDLEVEAGGAGGGEDYDGRTIRSEKIKKYVGRDVFERLQNEKTVSAKVKGVRGGEAEGGGEAGEEDLIVMRVEKRGGRAARAPDGAGEGGGAATRQKGVKVVQVNLR